MQRISEPPVIMSQLHNRVYSLNAMCEPCDPLFSKARCTEVLHYAGTSMVPVADTDRATPEKDTLSSISWCPSAKYNGPVMIAHKLLQITLTTLKSELGLKKKEYRKRKRKKGAGFLHWWIISDKAGAEPVRLYLETSHSFSPLSY